MKIQLLIEARGFGIEALIAMGDHDLQELGDGSVELARAAFEPTFSIDDRLLDLVRLVATVCELWADAHPDGDEAEERMLARCGLKADLDAIPKRVEVVSARRFSDTVMLIANRVALIGETTPTHR
jgi:hypothetical protein